MSFGGHVQDMINRIKYNEFLKKAHREQYQKLKDAQLIEKGKREPHLIREKNISEEELEKIKEEIRKESNTEKRKETTRNVIIIVFMIIIGLILLSLII